jgi:ribosome-associated protein
VGKRDKGFEWAEDEDDPRLIVPVVRPNRTRLKEERRELEQLVHELVALTPGLRRQLPLDASQLDALDDLANTRPTPARRRQLMRVLGLMAEVDVEAIKLAASGHTVERAQSRAAERWRDRLIAPGDEALHAFFDAHPEVDRQQLRQLVRAAAGGTNARAVRKLFEALREAAKDDEDEEPAEG